MLHLFKRLKSPCVVIFTTVFLSSATAAQALDAQHLLKQRLIQLHTFQAEFSQRVTDVENTLLQEATGSIALQYPNKLYWRLNKPNESELIADGQTLWQIDPFMEQVVALNQNAAIDNNPLILLTNPNGEAWDDFNVSEHNNEFVITPKGPQSGVAQLVLGFENGNLTEMKMIDGQQQVSALLFYDIKQNQKIGKDRFIFTLPEGYDLDDQRKP